MKKTRVYLIKDLEELDWFIRIHGFINIGRIRDYLNEGIGVYIYLDEWGYFDGYNSEIIGFNNILSELVDIKCEIRKRKLEILNNLL